MFREDIPSNSKTAAAIDSHAALTEISQSAEQEGLHQISSFIFEVEQQRLGGEDTDVGETDISAVTADLLNRLRKHLPDNSKTAAAIDRGAAWTDIAQCAEEEGLHHISAELFDAEMVRAQKKS